jgi:DNA-binding GntR family transcriptional regulator
MKDQSLALKVYQEIRKNILTSQLAGATRLKEDAWAKKLNVSRMAVREALTRLLGERLVYVGEKGGYFVASMSATDIRQIRELREILELGALRLVHRAHDPSTIAKLEKICDDFTMMVKSGYLAGAQEADLKFHETLVESTGNNKLLDAYHFSHIPLFHQKLGKTQTGMNDYDDTDREHRQIVKALKGKNLALAEETLIKHFSRGEAYVLNIE